MIVTQPGMSDSLPTARRRPISKLLFVGNLMPTRQTAGESDHCTGALIGHSIGSRYLLRNMRMSSNVLEKNCSSKSIKREAMSRMDATMHGESAADCGVPKCTMRFEKCDDGCRVYCTCDNETAARLLLRICRTLEGGCCTLNCCYKGESCLRCSFAACDCQCEMTPNGVCVCCTTSDPCCVAMIQAMCHCMCACCANGCECTLCINDVPVCRCGC